MVQNFRPRLAYDGGTVIGSVAENEQLPAERWAETTNLFHSADLAAQRSRLTALADGIVSRPGLSRPYVAFALISGAGDALLLVDTDPASATFGETVHDVALDPLAAGPVPGAPAGIRHRRRRGPHRRGHDAARRRDREPDDPDIAAGRGLPGARGARRAARGRRRPVTADQYGVAAEYLELLMLPAWRELRSALVAVLHDVDPAAGPVLDLGAGTGLGTKVILDTVPGARVLAVEPSPGLRAVLLARLAHDPDRARRVTVQPVDAAGAVLPGQLAGRSRCT